MYGWMDGRTLFYFLWRRREEERKENIKEEGKKENLNLKKIK